MSGDEYRYVGPSDHAYMIFVINENSGDNVDQLLLAVKTLVKTLKAESENTNTTIYRHEINIVALLMRQASESSAMRLARQARAQFQRIVPTSSGVTLSCGITRYQSDLFVFDSVRSKAQELVQRAQAQPGNKIELLNMGLI